MRRSNLFFVLAVSLLGSYSFAEEAVIEESSAPAASVSVQDHLIFSSAGDPNDQEAPATKLFMHEANIRGEVGSFNAAVRFSNRYTPDGDSALNKTFNLEKKTLALDTENWLVILGDSHQELGRGIALSLYRDPSFGLDNSLEGVSTKYRNADLEATIFGGRINALKAPVAINPIDARMADRNVYLAGLQVSGKVGEQSRLGGHYLATLNEPESTKRINERRHTVGLTFNQESIFEDVDAYLESNAMYLEKVSDSGAVESKPLGHGGYAALNWSPAGWKNKLEFKDYRNFKYDFQRPPTLEEDIVLSTNNEDVTATRVAAEKRLGDSSHTVFGSYLVGQDRELDAVLQHPVTGVRFKFSDRSELEVKGGYRWMPNRNHLAHAGAKAKIHTYKSQSLELGIRRQDLLQGINSRVSIEEIRNIADVGYSFSEALTVGVGYENLPTNASEAGNHFFNVAATYKTGDLTARGFLGKTSGGTQCSGGVCRQVPPYTGAYLETNFSF